MVLAYNASPRIGEDWFMAEDNSVAAPAHPGCSSLGSSSPCTDDSDIMDGGVAVEDFISTGRTGRRNAVADITDQRVGNVSTAGMDFSFDQLSVSESKQGNGDSGEQSSNDTTDKSQSASKS